MLILWLLTFACKDMILCSDYCNVKSIDFAFKIDHEAAYFHVLIHTNRHIIYDLFLSSEFSKDGQRPWF